MGGRFANRRRTGGFAFADTVVAPGTSKEVSVRIARLPVGKWVSMPVVVIHGARTGPTMWLSAAIHGDELNGVEIVRQLISAIDPAVLSGTVMAVPIVNVFGVSERSRYLPDRRDLNRSFPGSLRGSLASRLARLFFDNVAARCELGIDFHSGSGGRCNLPQVRCDLDDARTRRYARQFGAAITLHSNLRDGSLRAAAHEQRIPILLFEGGEAHRFDRVAIEAGVSGALRLMSGLSMIAVPDTVAPRGAVSRKSRWVRATRSGFCHLDVSLGDRVVKGQVLARVTDSVAPAPTLIRSKDAGVVIGTLQTGLVHRGDALIHVAEVKERSGEPRRKTRPRRKTPRPRTTRP